MYISVKTIAQAKIEAAKNTFESFHEHDDCIRIAFEWLDAQKKLGEPGKTNEALKHLIENWAGRYVSHDDVVVAAHLHPEIFGTYPNFNIGPKLIKPSYARLKQIGEAHTQNYTREWPDTYSKQEQNSNDWP